MPSITNEDLPFDLLIAVVLGATAPLGRKSEFQARYQSVDGPVPISVSLVSKSASIS